MNNNRVQLTGYLGEDAKTITKEGKSFTVINMATKNSYRVQVGEEIVWKETETEWHEVFVFNPFIASVANDLKKGDKAEITGTIAYKQFKDEKGHIRKQAFIKGHFIEKIDYEKH